MMGTVQHNELAEFDVTEDDFDAMLAESEPVEVTGPFDPARRVRLELYRGSLHTYRWRVVASNGEVLATGATSYSNFEDAKRAVTAFAAAMQGAPIVALGENNEPSAATG